MAAVAVDAATSDAIDAAAVDEATHRQKGMSIGAGSFCFYFTVFSSLPAAYVPHHQQTVNQRRREEPRAPLTPRTSSSYSLAINYSNEIKACSQRWNLPM